MWGKRFRMSSKKFRQSTCEANVWRKEATSPMGHSDQNTATSGPRLQRWFSDLHWSSTRSGRAWDFQPFVPVILVNDSAKGQKALNTDSQRLYWKCCHLQPECQYETKKTHTVKSKPYISIPTVRLFVLVYKPKTNPGHHNLQVVILRQLCGCDR